MKRFSKILTLILALVVIVTAFTVVALAAEPGYTNQKGHKVDSTFETFTAGSRAFDRSGGAPTNGGIFIGEAYPGGNKYLEIQTSTGSAGETRNTTWVGTEYSRRTKYTFANYPTIAIEFDIMSPTGKYGLYDATNTTNSAAYYVRPYVGSTLLSSARFNQVRFGQLGLSTTPYNWQHVTVVYEYYVAPVVINEETQETEDHEFLKQSAYVNGVLTKEWTVIDHTAQGITDSKQYFVGPLYFQSGRYFSSGAQKIAIDNIQFVYYEAGYDKSKIPTTIYNDTWEAPFGKLLATVTVGEGEEAVTTYYDDMAEAVEYAKATPGAKLSLAGNMTTNYIVDGEMTIDANIYGTDENGETIITGKYTGVDTYAKTTKGYYMKETAEGSGIYVATKGDFMLTTSAGVGTAYTADQLTAKLRSPGSGSIIKLLSDVEIDPSLRVKTSGSSAGSAEEGAIGVTTNFTLDLNGYSLRRVYYYGNEYVADENGVYPEEATAVAAKNVSLFDMENKAAVLNITSTAGTNGKLYDVGVKCNTWVKNGEIEKREIESYVHASLIYSITGGAVTDISNTDIYAAKLLGGVWGNNFVTIRLNHVNFYQMTSGTAASIAGNGEFIIQIRGNAGYDIQAENSFFYLNAPTPEGYMKDYPTKYGTIGLIRVNEAAPDSATAIVSFKNCDVISADNCHTAGLMNGGAADDTFVFENCRFYNNDRQAGNFAASHGTLSNYWKVPESHAYPPVSADGWTNETLKNRISITYTVPDISTWSATEGEVQSVDFGFGTKEIICQFNKIATKEVDVTVGENTVKLIPGVSTVYDNKALRIYADTESDMLLNTIYLLKDANENVIESILGIYDDNFSFDWENECVLTASEETMYVGGIKADFNLNFLTGFRYNLYIPADARLSDVVVEGFEKAENTITLYGSEYYVYYKVIGTAAAAEANVISATFKVNGEAYSQTWNINAISYADMLLDYPSDQYPNEKAALGAMAKFIKEAVALTEGSSADVAAIDALIAKSGVSTELGVYTDGNKDCLDPFGGSVKGVQFVVYNGVAAYKFITAAEDTEISFTVNGENVEFERGSETDEEENTEYYVILDAMRVYDLIDPISVTAGGVTASVSMLDYLTAMEGAAGMELSKALYEFGLAADEYKKDIMANN